MEKGGTEHLQLSALEICLGGDEFLGILLTIIEHFDLPNCFIVDFPLITANSTFCRNLHRLDSTIFSCMGLTKRINSCTGF